MSGGILAHLGRRMTKQQELLATEGLAYLLQNSEACTGVLRRLASQAQCGLPQVIKYRPEISGDDRDRPDVVGFDDQLKEVAILEGKFYAGLTDNQPNTYLSRLSNAGGGLLLFVVPELRLARLWKEVTARAGQEFALERTGEDAGTIAHLKVLPNVTLMMVSWRELLDAMMAAARSGAEAITADIYQLQVLCDRIQGEAFLPFSSSEVTGLNQPIRHRDLCNLVDAIVASLKSSGRVSHEGLNATPQRLGYIRYIWLGAKKNEFGAYLGLRYDLWQSTGGNPIWLGVQDADAMILRPVFQRIAAKLDLTVFDEGKRTAVALPMRSGLEFEELVTLSARVVTQIIDELQHL